MEREGEIGNGCVCLVPAAREGTRENYPCGGFAARAVEALDARDDFVNPF